MRKNFLTIISILFLAFVSATIVVFALNKAESGKYIMNITSNTIKDNELMSIEQAYRDCNGKNISPDLSWSGFPVETKSFAIVCHDPDAPVKGGWYHWVLVDIPSNISSIEKGKKIKGAKEMLNDYQERGYGGPCPPFGTHRYVFTVYALNTDSLDVSKNDLAKDVESKINYHSLASGKITGLYKK